MPDAGELQPLPDLAEHPLDLLRRWPADRPVVMLSSARPHARWARWSMLATPAAWRVLDGDELTAFARLWPHPPQHREHEGKSSRTFARGWIIALSYDLGRVLEPRAQHDRRPRDDRRWPLALAGRVEAALLFDHLEGRWWSAGDCGNLLSADQVQEQDSVAGFTAGLLHSSLSRPEYIAAAQRVIEYIRAGDVFQVNLARRLSASFDGSARALACAALASSQPWYGAYLELPGGRAVISLSPELFLEVRPSGRRIITRPIKGTLPVVRDARELTDSAKDTAELHMIVDLMRNDLGRVCEIGSVRVADARSIETHPTVHHGVAEVEGVLREECTLLDILRATFPPGSITGAPKIRAMQIIDELEPVSRGPYCGSIGFIGDDGSLALNVAIRTIALQGLRAAGRFDLLHDALLDYGTGGGIVADSIPEREWEETEHKAAVLRAALGAEP